MLNTNQSVENRLLSKVSSMYYDQNYNQQEIANRLHLSRPKVSRLLKKAREKGIVQISVVSPSGSFVDLEKSLEEKFDLQEALIIDADDHVSTKGIKRQIGTAASDYLHRTVSDGEIIGVTWGTTLQAMVDTMPPKTINNVHIVQALGGVGPPEAKAHATDISRRLSQLLKCKLTLLPAPGIVGSIEAKEVLLSDRQVKGALDLFSKIDTLFVGLGAIKTNPVLDKDSNEIPPQVYEKIMNSDAVGDIALHFFNIDGKEVETKLKDLVIGISIEEMKQIDTVVGIAGGKEKTEVIYGALHGKLIDVLITDHQTGKEILSR
jgi:DNA-binding transcriptional regulator LsrR (DeoR family)